MATTTQTVTLTVAAPRGVGDAPTFDHLPEIRDAAQALVNAVAACMLNEPKYYETADARRERIVTLVHTVAVHNPRFILQLALYVRDDLNIRTSANFLVALAASIPLCRPFIKRYFGVIIRLPTDILEVCSLYFALTPGTTRKPLPAALRKAITRRFKQFDVYQLAKWDKTRSLKRRRRLEKLRAAKKAESEAATATRGGVVVGRRRRRQRAPAPTTSAVPSLTMKQLVRGLHITQPAEVVMAILGKRYPADEEAWKKSGMTGEFDARRAGRRMRLPVPETWETQLTAKGNKATTWEDLINHNKLPFMAMLRNLRNLIVTGVSPEHHDKVIARLQNERAVANSRQFPFRFFSGYQAIKVDLDQLMNLVLDADEAGDTQTRVEVRVKGRTGRHLGSQRTVTKRAIIPVHMPDYPLIERYRHALDVAIRLATVNNVTPIQGHTVVFCDVSGSMSCRCSSWKSGGSINTAMEVAVLMGLMLKYVCESCDFRIFSSPRGGGKCHLSVELSDESILENMKTVMEKRGLLGGGTDFPYDYLEDLIEEKQKIDTFIILSDMMVNPEQQTSFDQNRGREKAKRRTIEGILAAYREAVNPDLLFVAVDLNGSGRSLAEVNDGLKNPRNVLITGFSDKIFRYIGDYGRDQLNEILSIDERKGITDNGEGPSGKEAGGDKWDDVD